MQALFKARFEQALESQKLNIKKIEQQLRRNGINPEDPAATASIQRVASSFFNAIDKKEGTPYIFHEENLSEPSNNFEPSESSDEKEQEELDKFIAEIEDAAEREWAAEEAAEKEDSGRIRYWNREEFGGRFRRAETVRGDSSYNDINGARSWKDTRGKPRTCESDDEDSDASDADDEWQSHHVRRASAVDSDTDEFDESEENFKVHKGDRRKQEKTGRFGNDEAYKRNAPVNLRKSMPEEDSDAENVLSDLETAMWQSDADEEHNSSTSRATNYNYRSESDEEEDSYNLKEQQGGRITFESSADDSDESKVPRVVKGRQNRTGGADDSKDPIRSTGANFRQKRDEEDLNSAETSSDSENVWMEAEAEEDSQASGHGKVNYWSSDGEEGYQVKRDCKDASDKKRTRTAREMDETWDSD